MCGRFGLTNPARLDLDRLLEQLQVTVRGDDVPDEIEPRYNIAPSTRVLAAFERPAKGDDVPVRGLALLKWGLVPHWAKEPGIGNRLANARSETIASTPAFRDSWRDGRRCLVPADVFYEWSDVADAAADPRNGDPGTTGRRPVGKAKPVRQPWAIAMADRAPFCFGGIWSTWRGPKGGDPQPPLHTVTLITTSPNELMATMHDRMPVIVPRERWDAWLSRATSLDDAAAMLDRYPASGMTAWKVSRLVNTPRNDGAELLDPVE